MNCWEKLHQGIADDIDKMMCASRASEVSGQIDQACLEFTEKVNSLIKEYPDECDLVGFNILFLVTDKRTKDQPLIQCLYGIKTNLQQLCTIAQEAIK